MAKSTVNPGVGGTVNTETIDLEGLDCADCALSLEKAIVGIPGVVKADVNFTASTLKVQYHPEEVERRQIASSVREAGYRVRLAPEAQPVPATRRERLIAFWADHVRGITTAASGLLLAAGFLLSFAGVASPLPELVLSLGIVVGGYHTARAALFALRTRSADMNVLMTAAVLGAIGIGEWTEAASVVFLFSLANTLQSYTMDRSRRSIRSLLELAPKEATLIQDGRQVKVPVGEIAVGDTLLVRPGERLATDGVVLAGSSTVNQAPITGESMPVEKLEGDEVYAGSVNQWGVLQVGVTRPHRDNTLSRIIAMVEEAQSRRAPSQQFVDRFARYYTPAVIGLAAAVAAVPPLFFGASFEVWFYRALVLLIIACPCALVISTPVSIASAVASASRRGVLFKGGAYLEALGNLRVIAFDKTGTLTTGYLQVTDIVTLNGYSEAQVLATAAALESVSEHPVARAVVRRAMHEGADVLPVVDFQAMPGLGAVGQVNGSRYFVGSPRLARQIAGDALVMPAVVEELERQGKTVVLLGEGDRLLGVVAVADQLRPESRAAVEGLHRAGMQRVVMLTGDNPRTAAAVASEAGLDGYQAELLPEDKQGAVQSLLDRYGRVAMVGDGVNDAPALAQATVGIAMGAAGTDTALETADVALMGDDLTRLPEAVSLSRATVSTIKQNIGLSIAVKLVFVVLASVGLANLWMAVLADMGTSLAVIANGMRLLRHRGQGDIPASFPRRDGVSRQLGA
jgi:Zn2+/Cd2+-exporting ATPase